MVCEQPGSAALVPAAAASRSDRLPYDRQVISAYTRQWLMFAGIFLVYLAYAVVGLFQQHSIAVRVVGIVLIAAFGVVYVVGVPRGAFAGDIRYRVGTPLLMTGIVVIYLSICGSGGLAMVPYLAVTVVLVAPISVGIPLVLAAGLAVAGLPQTLVSWSDKGWQWQLGGAVVLAGFVAVAVRANAGTQLKLHLAQEQIADMAAEQERLRIARDLHDILGHALTTITLKAELATRVVAADPARAAQEMAEVAELGRLSLTDVRATVAGYREVSLAGELATAREVLKAAGIEAELPAVVESVPGPLRELFGWVLREGVTNALRHSTADRLRVTVDSHVIEIVNNGVPDAVRAAGDGASEARGSGLAGLNERAAAVGGRVEAGRDGLDGYRLRVEVPA